ncbi:MAG TPA: pitrilysin family protein [Ktedonobacterales bacterium]
MYVRTTLPNGLRLVTTPISYVRSVSIAFFFGVGSRYEPDEIAGVSHFIEHMLFKGSKRYPSAQLISETIEGVGGILNASTDRETTAYTARIASRYFEQAMDLLADMVRHPRFARDEIGRERRVISEEIGMYMDDPGSWVSVLANDLFWKDTPLGREIAGSRDTVQHMPETAIREYHARHYLPNNLVISIAGDITPERAEEVVTRLLGDWQPQPAPVWTPCQPSLTSPRVHLEHRETEQTNFDLLLLGLPYADPGRYALSLLNTILGDSMSSRLFLEVRERQGLAYDVGSAPIQYHDTGAFSITAGVAPEQTGAALTAILHEVARIREEFVTPEELQRAKEYTRGRITLSQENTGAVSGWYGAQELELGEIRELDEELEHYDAVTREDIQRVAERIFREESLRLAMIGPHEEATPFERLLRLA